MLKFLHALAVIAALPILAAPAAALSPGAVGVVPDRVVITLADGVLPAPSYGTRMTVALGSLNSHGHRDGSVAGREDWVTGALAPAWGIRDVELVEPSPDAARWWGTPKLIEFAAARS